MNSTRTILILATGCVLTSVTVLLYLRNEETEHASPMISETQRTSVPPVISAAQPRSIPDDPNDAILSRYEGLAANSIKEAFTKLESETSGTQTSALRKILAQLLVNKDFTKLGEVIACLPAEERQFILSVVVPRGIARDKGGALTIIDDLGTTFRGQAYREAVRALLANGDSADAAAVLEKMPISEHRTGTLGDFGSALIRDDEAAFYSFLTSLQPDEVPDVANSAASHYRMKKDAAGMIRLVPFMSEHVKHFMIRSVVTTALERGERASLPSVLGKLTPPDREFAEASLLVQDESFDFRNGITKALQFQDQTARKHAIGGLVKRQLAESPVTAGEDVLQLPDGARESAIRSLVDSWYRGDRDQLANWVRQLPAGANRDIAIVQWILPLRRDDPAAANEAAALTSNQEERESLLRSLSEPVLGTP